MLYREIICVCSEIHTEHINTLCGQNIEFLNVKPGGTYSNQWAWKGWSVSWTKGVIECALDRTFSDTIQWWIFFFNTLTSLESQ